MASILPTYRPSTVFQDAITHSQFGLISNRFNVEHRGLAPATVFSHISGYAVLGYMIRFYPTEAPGSNQHPSPL